MVPEPDEAGGYISTRNDDSCMAINMRSKLMGALKVVSIMGVLALVGLMSGTSGGYATVAAVAAMILSYPAAVLVVSYSSAKEQ